MTEEEEEAERALIEISRSLTDVEVPIGNDTTGSCGLDWEKSQGGGKILF